jgi:hypothetical protein
MLKLSSREFQHSVFANKIRFYHRQTLFQSVFSYSSSFPLFLPSHFSSFFATDHFLPITYSYLTHSHTHHAHPTPTPNSRAHLESIHLSYKRSSLLYLHRIQQYLRDFPITYNARIATIDIQSQSAQDQKHRRVRSEDILNLTPNLLCILLYIANTSMILPACFMFRVSWLVRLLVCRAIKSKRNKDQRNG